MSASGGDLEPTHSLQLREHCERWVHSLTHVTELLRLARKYTPRSRRQGLLIITRVLQ